MAERLITGPDLEDIAVGAAILGTGGGGDPHIGRLLAHAAVRADGPARLVPLEDVPDDAVTVVVAMMGAPTVMLEKVPSTEQASLAVQALASYLGKSPTHLVCAEAGGVNALVPVVAAAQLGLPLIDADGMGRAFPELQMVMPTLYGIGATPMSIADEKGNRGIFDTVDNHWAERLARSATIDMGCSAMISLFPMTGAQAREALVPGTLSLCGELGRLVREARAAHRDPVAAVVGHLGGAELFNGKVVDVSRRTEGGFARGEATLEGLNDSSGERFLLRFQNEHLVAVRDGTVVATVPDLICVLDAEAGTAVTTETLRYGQRVRVIAAPCDPRWHSPEGLELVGPRYFGYDHDTVRVGSGALT
ncbi:DUF917 domain-containing protein [Planotetraspora kaengkrachanensis]|uniref:DUF917 domain-containing protein n=1 Tax=Planotetraspora kaengkrachanensis TaxID=575193 RepID=A0A8J3PRY7_9ACTN|nr:DUF917 domain-containing protein [Planotetraspora kaengkrachanensis]GIG78889.1 hypothetical protein Pka01_20160 [Planotetraspora kaengkrachanensis]